MSWFKKDTPIEQPVDEPELEKPFDFLEEPEKISDVDPPPIIKVEKVREPLVIVQKQPEPYGERYPYSVVGIWDEFGVITKIRDWEIQLQGHNKVYGTGDKIPMDRLEAAVIGKRYALRLEAK